MSRGPLRGGKKKGGKRKEKRSRETHLVVPRPPRVQLPPHGPDQLRQPPLVGRVDVLVPGLDLEGARPPLCRDGVEPRDDLGGLPLGQHRRLRKSAGVSLAALDVLAPHPLVGANRRVELFHQRVGRSGEATPPELLLRRRRGRRRGCRGRGVHLGAGGQRGGAQLLVLVVILVLARLLVFDL